VFLMLLVPSVIYKTASGLFSQLILLPKAII
jgi:hypothetical protein